MDLDYKKQLPASIDQIKQVYLWKHKSQAQSYFDRTRMKALRLNMTMPSHRSLNWEHKVYLIEIVSFAISLKGAWLYGILAMALALGIASHAQHAKTALVVKLMLIMPTQIQ
jgi:hypothetical protein